ncbi:ABC transporter permease subunit [Solwaraspora sp. WMMB335]|uniref:ABC transporter permease subunit n=1 Tax=Solwaraspora sp. WMMB335 TaxID=3404118 RepID=UPI003B9268A4
MNLYRAELRRLVKRRFVRYLVFASLLVLAIVAVGTFLGNQKVDPQAVAEAEQAAQQQYELSLADSERWRTECEESKRSGAADTGGFPADCAAITPPTRDMFRAQMFLPPTFEFRDQFRATLYTFVSLLLLTFFAVGASFVGAEWTSGGMMNLLLWRPRRLQVLLTKLAALLTGVLAVTVPAALAWTAGFWLIATNRGVTAGMTAGAWRSVALTEVRSVVLVVAAAMVGFGLATIGRHTALALGGALGFLVVVQAGLGFLAGEVRYPELLIIPTYWIAWMDSSMEIIDWRACGGGSAGCVPPSIEVTWLHTGGLIAVVVLAVLGVAAWTMRRRDIT